MSFSKREIITSLGILVSTGLVMTGMITFGVDRDWVNDLGIAFILLLLFVTKENWKEEFRFVRKLGAKGKVVMALAALLSLGLLVAAVMTVVREGNSPVRYLFIAFAIPLVVSLALHKLAKPNEAR